MTNKVEGISAETIALMEAAYNHKAEHNEWAQHDAIKAAITALLASGEVVLRKDTEEREATLLKAHNENVAAVHSRALRAEDALAKLATASRSVATDERKAFEAWCLKEQEDGIVFNTERRDYNSRLTGYKSAETNAAWRSWQARAALPASVQVVGDEEFARLDMARYLQNFLCDVSAGTYSNGSTRYVGDLLDANTIIDLLWPRIKALQANTITQAPQEENNG